MLPFQPAATAALLSERSFRRRLGLDGDASGPIVAAYSLGDIGRLARLSPEVCRALVLFDVLEAASTHGYEDLATARQVGRLLEQGIPLASIVKAAADLWARGLRLSQVRLAESPWGGLVQEVGRTIAELDGQFALVLDEQVVSAEACMADALASEQQGDGAEAERLYRRAATLDRSDPVSLFNLGNVLQAERRDAEAVLAFKQALGRDPSFVEAAFNLATLYESREQPDKAIEAYRAATQAQPDYAQAIYNHARLLTRLAHYGDALPLWDRFLRLAPDDPDAGQARRLALLCRLELQASA